MPHWNSIPFYRELLSLIAGVLIPLSLAPYKIWPAGLLACGIFAYCLFQQSAKSCLRLGFLFGLGMYAVGVSWVHVSISQFGASSPPVALFLTAAFITGLGFFFSLPFYVFGRWASRSWLSYTFGFAAIWVLNEWMRSWLLTGFPWLYIGYAHVSSPLAGWGPLFGIYALSFASAYTGAILSKTIYDATTVFTDTRLKNTLKANSVGLGFSVFLWLGGFGLSHISWTTHSTTPVTIGMAQGNIPQDKKWLPSFQQPTIDIFRAVSEEIWDNDWVIWPEAAIPIVYHQAAGLLAEIDVHAKNTDTVFMTGIIYDEVTQEHFYNTITTLGKGSGNYFKQRLVPFGEYVPMEKHLRGLINFFNLPTSIINTGPSEQSPIFANDLYVSPYICYEIVYPDLVARRAKDTDILVTISNDAWFGNSIGPLQHFQMARMRAIETGRYVVRSTNNGISGIINPKGEITVHGGRFTREAIEGVAFATKGSTPFMIWRSWPMVLICFVVMVLCWRLQRHQ